MAMITTFFQLHNKASAPAAAEVPVFSFELSVPDTGAQYVLELGADFFTVVGHYFTVGCSYGLSSTAATFTAETQAVNLIVNGERSA